jgi:hypothetical protein
MKLVYHELIVSPNTIYRKEVCKECPDVVFAFHKQVAVIVARQIWPIRECLMTGVEQSSKIIVEKDFFIRSGLL